jgi:hypothetical protein
VFTAVKDGTVKLLKVPGKKLIRSFYLVRVKRESSPPVRTFHEFVKQYKFFIPF